MKLRSKLLLAALVLLLIPVVMVNFLKSLDSWLVERERAYLQERAQNLAAGISPFMKNWTSVPAFSDAFPVFPKRLSVLPTLDGFESEWGVTTANWIPMKNTPIKIILGQSGSYQLLFIKLRNLSIGQQAVFRLEYQSALPSDPQIQQRNFYISAEAPGKILAKNSNHKLQSRIHGYWQSSSSSPSLELRVPDDLTLSQLRIQVTIDARTYKSSWLHILKTAPEQQHLLDTVSLSTAERLWLLGADGEVMGVKGNLQGDSSIFSSNAFLRWLIGTVPDTVNDPWSGVSQIPQLWLQKAREKGMDSRIEPGVNANQKRIVSVARIGAVGDLQGYILFDKLSGTSLLLSQPQVGMMINIMLALMLVTIIILLVFGGRLSWRIQDLQKQLSSSMDDQGRVIEMQQSSSSADEIGQLSRSMKRLLYRQKDYQEYQQKMSSRLSHELRTPIAVVRGALDNLSTETREDNLLEFVERATTGIERMASLVTRMREAARLEQVINASSMITLDLNELLQKITLGLSSVWPKANIYYNLQEKLEVTLAPELIAQALEKIVSNAIDFATEDSKITIYLEATESRKGNEVQVLISNFGELLPQGKESQLTENMVSIRAQPSADSAHLGLGLYMVQLIARFHGGEAIIRNRDDELGVISGFTIQI